MKKITAIILSLMLLVSCATAHALNLTEFKTTDMEGNEVTQEIFSDYDLTMVNIWATWCIYCIEEMPYFEELKNSLPENVNLITICDDASVEPDLVNAILEASNANFQTLIPNDDINNQVLNMVYGFPTTLFLDSEGRSVIKPLAGIPSQEDPAGAYLEIIHSILDLMGV